MKLSSSAIGSRQTIPPLPSTWPSSPSPFCPICKTRESRLELNLSIKPTMWVCWNALRISSTRIDSMKMWIAQKKQQKLINNSIPHTFPSGKSAGPRIWVTKISEILRFDVHFGRALSMVLILDLCFFFVWYLRSPCVPCCIHNSPRQEICTCLLQLLVGLRPFQTTTGGHLLQLRCSGRWRWTAETAHWPQ